MSSDHKGVEPSIEEILASIRRIIADSTSPTPNTFATSHAPQPLNSPQRIDDDEAFELPAMFRSPHSLAHHLPPQIGDIDLDGHRIDWQQRLERCLDESGEMAVDRRRSRDSKVIEELGSYNPVHPREDQQVALNRERIEYWLSVGALPTDTVRRLLQKAGIVAESV